MPLVIKSHRIKNKISSPPGHFMRKALFTAGLAFATVFPLNAQEVKQLVSSRDSLKVNTSIYRSIYQTKKKNAGQAAANIEFVGQFKVSIPKNPLKELKITDNLVLSIDEQKALRKEGLIVETDTHVLSYFSEYDGFSYNLLHVYKKKQ